MEEPKQNSQDQSNIKRESIYMRRESSNKIIAPIYESYLEKKARNIFSGWQTRYFVFLEGKIIIYTESKESKQVKGYILIKQISDIKSTEENTFLIETENRTFQLKAENEDIKESWIEKIKNAIANIKKGESKDNNSPVDRSTLFDTFLKSDEKDKLNTISMKTGNIIKKYGYVFIKEDTESMPLLEKYGINQLINLNDEKILNHIRYGFMFKKKRFHDSYNKRWFFLISRSSLNNNEILEDYSFLDDKKQKDWLKFDTLYYFRYDKDKNEDNNNVYDVEIKMDECHKIINVEKDGKYFINLDYSERLYEFYCESKNERDEWFQALINSRNTAKTYKFSITKHPKNIESLYKIYVKNRNLFLEKLNTELIIVTGNIEEINEFTVFEFTVNNLQNLIESNMDGCLCSIPMKIELLKFYAYYMNTKYLNIYQRYWENSYNNLDKEDIIRMGLMLLNYYDEIKKFNVNDVNLLKNGKEFVKIYFKNIFPNILFSIENMLKYEIEHKGTKNSEGIYYSEGPKLIFDIFWKIFDLVKNFKHKEIISYLLKILNMSLFQYCFGINYVISNQGIIMEDEYLISIANDTLTLNQLLNDFIESCKKLNILTEEEINEELHTKNLINIIDKLCYNSLIHLVYEHKDDLEKEIEDKKFLKMEFDKIIKKSGEIYSKYKQMMNSKVIKIFYNEVLKLTLCYYITRLLLITDKKKRKREDIIDKIKKDKELLSNSFKNIVGENLTNATLSILDNIIGILEIDKSMISTTILTIRQYIGPAFTYSVAKKLIKLRSDLNKQEKIDCKSQCEEVLNNYEGPKDESSSYFQILHSKIKDNKKDKKFVKIKESHIKYGNEIEENKEISGGESDDDKNENDKDENNIDIEEEVKGIEVNMTNEKYYINTNLENFLKDNDDEIEEETEDEEQKDEIKQDSEEDTKPDLDGVVYKRSNSLYKKYYFQVKNCGLYWFEDDKYQNIKNKLSLKNITILNSDSDPNKFTLKNSNEKDKEYKYKCDTEEQKNALVKAISKAINNSKTEQKSFEIPKIEIKERKKVIKDFLKMNNKIKGNYIEDKILDFLKTGKYFKINKKKMEKVLKKNLKKKEKEEKEEIENLKEKDEDNKKKKSVKTKIKNFFKGK